MAWDQSSVNFTSIKDQLVNIFAKPLAMTRFPLLWDKHAMSSPISYGECFDSMYKNHHNLSYLLHTHIFIYLFGWVFCLLPKYPFSVWIIHRVDVYTYIFIH